MTPICRILLSVTRRIQLFCCITMNKDRVYVGKTNLHAVKVSTHGEVSTMKQLVDTIKPTITMGSIYLLGRRRAITLMNHSELWSCSFAALIARFECLALTSFLFVSFRHHSCPQYRTFLPKSLLVSCNIYLVGRLHENNS